MIAQRDHFSSHHQKNKIMAFVNNSLNTTLFKSNPSRLRVCQRRPRANPTVPSHTSTWNTNNITSCKAEPSSDDALAMPNDFIDTSQPPTTSSSTDYAAVLPRTENNDQTVKVEQISSPLFDEENNTFVNAHNENVVAQPESDVCRGEFMYSPSLNKHANDLKSGLIPHSRSLDPEWSDTWSSAVSDTKGIEMERQYARVGILIESNFSDFTVAQGCKEAYQNTTIEDIALIKAHAVYEGLGRIPCITEMTEMTIDAPESGSRINKSLQQGYYTRSIMEEANIMLDRVRPISDENRIVRFRSVAVYYDGENEVVTEKKVICAMIFAEASISSIASSAALDELYKELTKKFDLTFTSFGPGGGKDGSSAWGNTISATDGKKRKVMIGATLLRERILREGKLLGDGIIKVSSFLNHMVDTDLMEVCGVELAERLRRTMPNKVLTVESTGLIAGLPTARRLGIPLVFARKSRPITISDSYQTTYRSSTKGTTSELIVSCEYLDSGDRVIIIDDFLAGGSTAEGLFKLARMAHAKVVGVGVLIEKLSDGGRTFLSGYDVPVESLAKVSTDDSGGISVVEENPWVPEGVKKLSEEKMREAAIRAKAKYYSKNVDNDDVNAVDVVSEVDIVGDTGKDIVGDEDEDEDDDDEDAVAVIGWEEDELLDEIEDGLVRENHRA